MSYLTAVLLGLVQGITEFLPISSSGHLALLQNIFNIEEADLMLDAMLHLGTLLAVFAVYKTEVRGLFRGGFALIGVGRDARSSKTAARIRKRLALLVLIGTLPLLAVLPFWGKLSELADNTIFVGLMLMVSGLILYVSNRRAANGKAFRHVTGLDALLVGVGQALSAVPGISRSGTIISVGMLRGFQRSFAVKFAYLLSIPAVLGSVILKLFEAMKLGFDSGMLPMYLIGMLVAAVSGYSCIRIMRWTAARGRMGGFAYYCWGAGIVALLLSLVA